MSAVHRLMKKLGESSRRGPEWSIEESFSRGDRSPVTMTASASADATVTSGLTRRSFHPLWVSGVVSETAEAASFVCRSLPVLSSLRVVYE